MQTRKIDIKTWERKESYYHYISFQNPNFNLTAPLEIGPLYDFCKQNAQNLYFSYLHLTTRVVNEIDEFHYRINEDGLTWYERIDCAPTVLNENKKLLFSHLDYYSNQKTFIQNSQKITQEVLDSGKMDAGYKQHVIYATALPWVSFTSVQHPVSQHAGNGIPLIAFGKIYEQNDKKWMPVSLDVNHALMDGYHAGLFFEKLQEYFLNPA